MKILKWLDNIEVAVVAIASGLLLLIGPLLITYRFGLVHRYEARVLIGALWLCSVLICIRDFRRKRLSWVSGGVLALWAVTTLVLGFIVA